MFHCSQIGDVYHNFDIEILRKIKSTESTAHIFSVSRNTNLKIARILKSPCFATGMCRSCVVCLQEEPIAIRVNGGKK